MKKSLMLLSATFLFCQITWAQLSGTKTIPGDYFTMTAAINDLNTSGVGPGGVIFEISSNFVFTEDCPVITATGTAANPIIFRKSGAGMNPKIRSTGTAGTSDAGIAIAGGDYITFDGIDIMINMAAGLEYGYYLYNASDTDGAQNNTIKNTTITLNRTNTLSCGIYQNTAIVPSDQATGNNNNNKYYNITIENAFSGVYLKGNSATFFDSGCEIGITAGGSSTIGSASANDIGNAFADIYGIRASYQSNINIFDVTIRNVSGQSPMNRVAGIFIENAYGTSAIYNNKIGPVSSNSTMNSNTNYMAAGLRLDVAAGSTLNVYNNFIFGITTAQFNATLFAASSVVHASGIVTGNTSGTTNFYNNNIRIETSTNINSACITSTGISDNLMRLKNNVLANMTPTQSGTPKHYGFMRQGATGTIDLTDYNDYYIQNSTNGFVGYYAADKALLSDWQAILVPNQDQHSLAVDPAFASSTDLHTSGPDLNAAGVTIAVANSDAVDITTDIDGTLRGTPPDLSADEFQLNDITSIAEAPVTQVAAGTVTSIANSSGTAVEVFRFKITDQGNTDGMPTIVTNIRIQNANPVDGASWLTSLMGVKLNDGVSDIVIMTPTIAASYLDIPIPSGNLIIADGTSTTLTFSIYLRFSGIEDNKKLQFTIPATGHGFTASLSGSTFASDFGAAITSNEQTIAVTATKLNFSNVTASVIVNNQFSATVSATDANGNADLDNTASVTISKNSGSGTLSSASGLTQSLVAGTKTWNDLKYNQSGTFKIQADGGSLTQAVSDNITSSNTIIVGDGSMAQGYPFNMNFGYSRNAALYTQAEIGAYLSITNLSWQVAFAQSTNCPIKIYLKEVSENSLTSDTWDNMIAGASLVYDGTVQFSAMGWNRIDFAVPFDYNTDNLLVLTEGNYGLTGSGFPPYFSYTYALNKNSTIGANNIPPAGALSLGNSRPNLKFILPTDMSYSTSTTDQLSISSQVDAGTTEQQVIQIQVYTNGTENPLSLTNFRVNANGTTHIADISNAKIFYTGNSDTYETTTQFGATIAVPTLLDFDIPGSQALLTGVNYFWLAFDLSSEAIISDQVDAECSAMTIGGVEYVPIVTAPAGSRNIHNKSLTSIAGAQASPELVGAGIPNMEILRLAFDVDGPATGSLKLNSIVSTFLGNTAADIAINGVKLYTTLLPTFSTTDQIGISQSLVADQASFLNLDYNLPSGTTYVWVAYDIAETATAMHLVGAKIDANNINVGGNNYNVADIDPGTYRQIAEALHGTYTLGVGGDFTSFTNDGGLFQACNNRGVSADLTVNVISDVLDESGGLHLDYWLRVGGGHYSLTIKPDAAVNRTLSGSHIDAVFRILGPERVTIDGSFGGNGKYLTFKNNNESNTTASAFRIGTSFWGDANASNLSIKNCMVYAKAVGISIGSSINATIEDNDIYSDEDGNIYANCGIWVNGSPDNMKITRNRIYNFFNTLFAYETYGIWYDGTIGTNEISNNLIYNIMGSGTNNSSNPYFVAGIFIEQYASGQLKIYNNSINMTGPCLGIGSPGNDWTGRSACILIQYNFGLLLDIRNNILHNEMNTAYSSVGNHELYCIYTKMPETYFQNINNNDYYIYDRACSSEYIGFLDYTRNHLAEWQTATGQDTESLEEDPHYTSSTDLKPVDGFYLSGTVIPSVTVDFDKNPRYEPYSIGAYEGEITGEWLGQYSTDWSNPFNWSNGIIPNASIHAYIGQAPVNQPHITTDFASPSACNNLTIMNGAQLTIDAGKALTVNGTLYNHSGTDGLILKSNASGTASLLHNTANVDVTIERYFTGNPIPNDHDFHFVSMPLNATGVAAQFIGMYLYRFDVPEQKWVNMGSSTTTQIFNDQAYMVFYPAENTTKNFVGQMNNGAFVDDTPMMEAEQYCLVPNPYPSAINWDAAGWTKSNLYDAFWIWNPSIQNYSTYGSHVGTFNATSNIPVGQGFLVQSSAASPLLILSNSVRVHHEQSFYKESEEIIPEVFRLLVKAPESADEIIVRFSEHAMASRGNMDVDKVYGSQNAPQLYSLTQNDEKLTINALNHSSQTVSIPVGLEYAQDGQLSITASGLQSFTSSVSVFLEDKLLNKTIDLRENPVYTFTNTAGADPMRFNLLFYGVNGTEELTPTNYNIWANNDKINILIPDLIGQNATVELIDQQGRILNTNSLTLDKPSSIRADVKSGLYIVRIVSGKQAFTSKVFIR